MTSKVQQLLNSLKKNNLQVPSSLDSHILQLKQPAGKAPKPQPRIKQQKALRKANYMSVQEDMDKWLPIVKVNREKDHLDFSQKHHDQTRVTHFPSNDKNPLALRVAAELEQLGVASEKQLQSMEEQNLKKLDPEEAKSRLRQMRKQRSLVFYEEMKRKRISKIKSKLYHRIKKRQRMKEELENYKNLSVEEKEQQMQKIMAKRAEERIGLRHKTKNRHIMDIMRFSKGNKNKIQQSINEINRIRREQLEKLDEEVAQEISEEYDEENFRQQAIQDLENEVQVIEALEGKKSSASGLKFMDRAVASKLNNQKKQAYRLMEQLKNNPEQMDVEEPEQEQQDNIPIKSYAAKGKSKSNSIQKSKPQKISKILGDYLAVNSTTPEALTKGIDVEKVREKYQSDRMEPIQINQFIAQNQELFENIAVQENREEFEKEKHEQLEREEVGAEKKPTKGWGSWTGPGIAQKPKDPKRELEIKLRKIEELRQKRKDGKNQDTIIHEQRNKEFVKDYLLSQVPYEYKSKQHFEYTHSTPVGPEWNSMRNFKGLIEPKVKTRVGEAIQPVKMPRNLSKMG